MPFPLIPLIGGALSGLGSIAGAIIGGNSASGAQASANAANLDATRETNAANAALAERANTWSQQSAREQMDFQERMSNSAYQRSTQDMKAAGLNPMLAFSQGGASTPSGSSITAQSASMDAPKFAPVNNSGLGDAFSKVGPSAMAAATTLQEMASRDSQIAATNAAKDASEAKADETRASAQAIRANLPSVEARASSARSEAEERKATSDFNKKAATYDGVMKRVYDAVGGFFDAVNVRRVLQGSSHSSRNQTMREEEHLRRQGSYGTTLP